MIGNLLSRLGDPSEEAFLGKEGGRGRGGGEGGKEGESSDGRCQAHWSARTEAASGDASLYSLLNPSPPFLPAEMLIRLGKRHQALGVKPQQYSSMRRSILASLEELLGHEWNSEYSDAWASVFNFISHVMIKAAQEEGQRVARAGKEEEARNVNGPQPSGGTEGGGGGGGSGCPFAATTRVPVNKVLSGLQLDALNGNNIETDGHFLHQAVAGSEGGGGATDSSSRSSSSSSKR